LDLIAEVGIPREKIIQRVGGSDKAKLGDETVKKGEQVKGE
jgi:hypothetical protein